MGLNPIYPDVAAVSFFSYKLCHESTCLRSTSTVLQTILEGLVRASNSTMAEAVCAASTNVERLHLLSI